MKDESFAVTDKGLGLCDAFGDRWSIEDMRDLFAILALENIRLENFRPILREKLRGATTPEYMRRAAAIRGGK